MRFVILFLFTSISGFSQSTFNKTYQFPDIHFLEFETIVVENDTIICYGDAIEVYEDSTSRQGVFVAQIDSSGEVLNHRMIFDTISNSILATSEEWGNIIPLSKGGYAAMASSATIKESHFLMLLNDDLSLKFMKEFPDTINMINIKHSIIEVNGGYLIWGDFQKHNYDLISEVRYLDYEGELIWEHHFSGMSSRISDIAMVEDSIFYVIVNYEDEQHQPSYFGMVRFDLDGTFEQVWQTNADSKYHFVRRFHALSDGGFLISGIYETRKVFNDGFYIPFMIKLDRNFQIEKEQTFGYETGYPGSKPWFYDFEENEEHIISVGKSYTLVPDDFGYQTGVVYHFNKQGDSTNSYHYITPFGTTSWFQTGFIGMGRLSSGNMIFGGSTNIGEYYGWLIKTDSNGCMEPYDCSKVSSIDNTNVLFSKDLNVYPNPTSNTLYWSDSLNDLRLVDIYDFSGSLLVSEKITNRQTEIAVNNLSAGIYILRLSDANGNFVSKRFQIIR